LGLYFHIVELESIPNSSFSGDYNAPKRDGTAGSMLSQSTWTNSRYTGQVNQSIRPNFQSTVWRLHVN
jgi:hypothetical protein